MDENLRPEVPSDDNWLDEILGTNVPKEVSSKELASQTGSLPKASQPAFYVPEDLPLDLSDEEFWESLKRAGVTDEITPETPISDIIGETDNPLDLLREPTQQIPMVPVTPLKDTPLVPMTHEESPLAPMAPEKAPAKPAPSLSPAKPLPTEKPVPAPAPRPPRPQAPTAPAAPKRSSPVKKDTDRRWQPVPMIAEPEDLSQRPKPKGGYGFFGIPHIFSTFIWMIVVVICGVTLGRTLWVCCADLMAFGKGDMKITVTITDEEVVVNEDGTKNVDVDSVAKKLADAGLIEYPELFKFFVTATDKDQDIIAGTFTLNSYYDYNAMVNAMSYYAPAREEVTVMIPEGYTCAQIFKLLEDNNVCTIEELEAYAANGELQDYWFLEGVKRGDKYCLEGYLFPDTYDFYTYDEPKRVLEKFLAAFDYRFTDLMKEDLINLRTRFNKDFTLHDIVTIASIIEKETSGADESYDISSVFYNRLTDPNFYPRLLGADATVHYAIGDYFNQVEHLTQANLDVNSPYNTRKYEGLPPGAICSPGRESLYAALDPNVTGYLYYVYDPDEGCHLFAYTYDEHLQNVASVGE